MFLMIVFNDFINIFNFVYLFSKKIFFHFIFVLLFEIFYFMNLYSSIYIIL